MADKPKAKPKAKTPSKPKKEAKPVAPAAGKAGKKAAKPAGKTEGGKSAKKTQPAAAAPASSETYYVSFVVPAQIHDAPPATSGPFAEFSSFDEAREQLLEHLIEIIDALEHRLHTVRRVGSFDEYRDLHR